jgi:hypothetical protein
MVTGFALVLYSRLHIICHDRIILRSCLGVILTDTLLFHPPVIIGSTYNGVYKELILRIGFYLDVFFALQETGLAGLYVYFFIKFVKRSDQERETKSMFNKLVIAECVVFCIEAILLGLLWAPLYLPRESIPPFFYAIKLKLEFYILNLLVQYSQTRHRLANAEINEYPGLGGTDSVMFR